MNHLALVAKESGFKAERGIKWQLFLSTRLRSIVDLQIDALYIDLAVLYESSVPFLIVAAAPLRIADVWEMKERWRLCKS